MKLDARLGFGAAAAVPLAAICSALVTQHVFGMQPCPWCVLQRLIFAGISLMALTGLLLRAPLAQRAAATAMLALAGCGIAAALWQHFVAAASKSCNLTLADRVMTSTGLDALWPQVFAAYASCADAAAKLAGISYEFYSLTLFVLLAGTSVALLLRPHPATA